MDISEMMEQDVAVVVGRGGVSQLMEEDAVAGVSLPSDGALAAVSQLANEQLRLEELLARKEEELRTVSAALTKVREFDLPNAMEALGLASFSLLDGNVVGIREEVYASITEEHRAQAFEWLENTSNEGIIKHEVKVPFGKGQDADSRELVSILTEKGYSFSDTRSVHPQTLKSFVRHQLADALPIPLDLFGVHLKRISKIEKSKR